MITALVQRIRKLDPVLLLLCLCALILRLALWSQPLHQPANDEVEYLTVAQDLLAGRGWVFYEHYPWLRAPLYPLFLAGSLWLAGGDMWLAALPNIALSVVTVPLSYRIARELGGERRVARLSAAITAVLFTLATFASLYMGETLFTFLLSGGLLLLLRWRRTGYRRTIIAAGILLGLATLTRSITLAALPAAALWIAFGGSPKSLVPNPQSLLFIVCCALTLAPWTIHNCRVYDRCILVETGLSYNLWAFNEPRESERAITDTLESIANPAERADFSTAKGLARLREDPAILARKLWPNWAALLRVKPIEDRFLLPSYYADPPPLVFLASLVLDDGLYLLILVAGSVGLWLLPDRRAWLLCGGWLGYVALTTALTHGEGRYRHFLFPLLVPCAALFLTKSTSKLPRLGRTWVPAGALLALAVGTALSTYPWQWAAGGAARSGLQFAGDSALALGWPTQAADWYESAVQFQETPDSWVRLGNGRRAAGDTAAALLAYKTGSGLAPTYLAPNALRGDLLRELGQRDRARASFAPPYTDPQAMLDWSWEHMRPAPISSLILGDGLDFGYVGGFYPAEVLDGRRARWSKGQGLLRLKGGSGTRLLRLTLAAPQPGGTNLSICSAGNCATLQVGPNWRSYTVALPPTAGPEIVVELRSPTFAATDGRQLGVLVSAAALTVDD